MTAMVSREEFDAEMAERDRRVNEWRSAMNADQDDMRVRLANIQDALRETQEVLLAQQELIKENAASLTQLWREFFGHVDPQIGGH